MPYLVIDYAEVNKDSVSNEVVSIESIYTADFSTLQTTAIGFFVAAVAIAAPRSNVHPIRVGPGLLAFGIGDGDPEPAIAEPLAGNDRLFKPLAQHAPGTRATA